MAVKDGAARTCFPKNSAGGGLLIARFARCRPATCSATTSTPGDAGESPAVARACATLDAAAILPLAQEVVAAGEARGVGLPGAFRARGREAEVSTLADAGAVLSEIGRLMARRLDRIRVDDPAAVVAAHPQAGAPATGRQARSCFAATRR
jgi:hypothetical protein